MLLYAPEYYDGITFRAIRAPFNLGAVKPHARLYVRQIRLLNSFRAMAIGPASADSNLKIGEPGHLVLNVRGINRGVFDPQEEVSPFKNGRD